MLFVIIYSNLFCRFMSYQCYLLLFTQFVLQEVHVLSMLFVIIYSICFAGGSCLINVICYYLLHLFCRRFMSYQCYLLLFTPFVLQEVHVLSMLFVIIYSICFAGHVLSMLFVIIYSICFAGGSCLINVICYYLLHLFFCLINVICYYLLQVCRSCLINVICYYLLHLFCRSCLINVICYYLLHLFCRRFMSYQCYLLLFTPFVLQVHVLSMLFVIIYSICFAAGSCLINVICYYLLHLFCRRFMSYQCYLLLFTPFVLSYQCYLLLFTSFVLRVMSYQCYLLLFTHLFCSCLINVICYYLLHLFCRRFMSYQCYLLLFTPFVLQVMSYQCYLLLFTICFAGGSCLINVICYYLLHLFCRSCLINVICYYLLHLFCRRFMSYQCYLLLFTPFVLQVMSYQCYLLLFTPIVLQEVHVLSMLFVIIYSNCFAGGSCLINVICYYLLHLFCRRFMSYQCYLLLFTPFVLQEVHVLSMLFVIIYSNVICYYL